MPLAKQIKYKKNFFLSEKDNKSTCINSDMSTSTKKENTFQNKLNTNTFNDFNTISDTKKYSLIQRDSRNNKSLTNKVQYVVYDENNNLLNLSVCEGKKISISYAIREDSDFSLTRYAKFAYMLLILFYINI